MAPGATGQLRSPSTAVVAATTTAAATTPLPRRRERVLQLEGRGRESGVPGGGILDFDRADNPFADYSFVYVPWCTGDLYLGDITREYSPAEGQDRRAGTVQVQPETVVVTRAIGRMSRIEPSPP
jgi:hypothetical protein